jgi:UDP-2,3-diacylglucosamine hydrolase
MSTSKKVYFASDFHLGAPTYELSLLREKNICSWMDSIQPSCEALYLVGDIFDFWFEYKYAIPKGFTRILGKIASFTDAGIPVHVFTGNHDMWIFDYLPKELGIQIYRSPVIHLLQGKRMFIGHGDGLGPGDYNYKRLKKIFESPIAQFFFGILHPTLGIGLADFLSKRSRAKSGHLDEQFLGVENEWLVQYAKEQQSINPVDYYLFGHRHLPLNISITEESSYYNIGDWIKYNTYGVLENGEFELYQWDGTAKKYDFTALEN